MKLKGVISSVGTLTGTIRFSDSTPLYIGSYEVTPAQYAQILRTKGKRMVDDVTVNPIPSNYGLISWDGSVMTVS